MKVESVHQAHLTERQRVKNASIILGMQTSTSPKQRTKENHLRLSWGRLYHFEDQQDNPRIRRQYASKDPTLG